MKESNVLHTIKTAEDYRQQALMIQHALMAQQNLVDLSKEFGCPPNTHTLLWLRERLVVAQSIKPILPINNMSRDEARSKLSMMRRGQVININGWKIRFSEQGFFIVTDEKNRLMAETPSLRGLLEVLFD